MDEGKATIVQMKYARIIDEIAAMKHVSREEAMALFYNSDLMPLIDAGVADLHCRSDKYLAQEILNP
jgi:hypothetical protein